MAGTEPRRDVFAWIRAGARGALCALLFCASLVGVVSAAVSAMDRAGEPPPTIALNVMRFVAPNLEALARAAGETNARRVAFLGDSISISTKRSLPVPAHLRQELRARVGDGAFSLHSLAGLGMGPFEYYFLADEVVAAAPDEVVIAFSLNAFGATWRSLTREQLSGWVAPRRVPEAASMPIHWVGLTLDELLLNVGILQAGGLERWRWLASEQARVGKVRNRFRSWLGQEYGRRGPASFAMARSARQRRQSILPGRERYNALAERNHYGPFLERIHPDHPVLVALGATIRHFEQAGIRTLVYVNPINREHLEALGVLNEAALASSLAVLEATVRTEGGDFLDLHDLLPDVAFRDAAGHLRATRSLDSPALVARAVAPHLLRDRSH